MPRKKLAEKHITRIEYIKHFLIYLFNDLCDFKNSIDNLYQKEHFPEPLRILITKYCKELIYLSDNYPTESGKVTVKGKQIVSQIKKLIVNFETDYSKLKEKNKVSQKINSAINELNECIKWFSQQHDMTVNSYVQKKNKNLLSHRPKKLALREFFIEETTKYQVDKGADKFIPYKIFMDRVEERFQNLENKDYQIKERAYYNLKQSWKKTF